jgi:hypothetical protein
MIKLHYKIADALDECLEMLNHGHGAEPHAPVKPRTSLLREKIKTLKEMDGDTAGEKFSLPPFMKSASNVSDSACSETSLSSL